uniref:Uncharacterized protein n=1 Tax=Anopheles albimanus TaxID=7167 RepID=A0A182FKX6_ANOAL
MAANSETPESARSRPVHEERGGPVGAANAPTKTSEITIIMRTVLSSSSAAAPSQTANTSTVTSAAKKKHQPGANAELTVETDDRPALGNRIEVTTSVKTVLECPDTGAAAAVPSCAESCAEAAALGLLLQPVLSKNFIALLKSANDSSFENVLEFKSLLGGGAGRMGAGGGVDGEHTSKHGLSSEESDMMPHDEQHSPSSVAVTKKPKTTGQCHGSEAVHRFSSLPTSTPIKIRISREESTGLMTGDRSDVTTTAEEQDRYRLNLLTPPADASFIDSDFESMEQDQYDTCSSKSSSRQEHHELTQPLAANGSLDEPCTPTKGQAAIVNSFCPSPTPTMTTTTTTMTPMEANRTAGGTTHRKASSTKAFFEEALKTPLAIRKHFQKRRNSELPKQSSHGNLLHFFSAKKKSNSLEGGLKSPRAKRSLTTPALTSENSSENGSSRCTSPTAQLLTEDNLRRLSVSFVRSGSESPSTTLVWGENYDYSFECEPSHSDVEEEEGDGDDGAMVVSSMMPVREQQRRVSTKLVHFDVSPDTSYEMQPAIVPSFKIDPAPRAAGLLVGCGLMGAAYATAMASTGFLKRSVSDPINCKVRSHSCTPLTSDIGESDEELLEGREDEEDMPMMRAALIPLRPFTSVHQASVRSLDKIGVSLDDADGRAGSRRVLLAFTH